MSVPSSGTALGKIEFLRATDLNLLQNLHMPLNFLFVIALRCIISLHQCFKVLVESKGIEILIKCLSLYRLTQILLQPHEEGSRRPASGEVEVAASAKPKLTSGKVKVQGMQCCSFWLFACFSSSYW